MKVLQLTREYPPHIYGGAGVVVDQLTQALKTRMKVEVRCFGAREPTQDGVVVRLHGVGAAQGGQGRRAALRAGAGDAVDRARDGA